MLTTEPRRTATDFTAESAAPSRSDTLAMARWGWFLPLFVAGSAGICVIAAADAMARRGAPGAQPLFWAGLVVVMLPLGLRALAPSTPRLERVASLVALALLLTCVKVLQSPGGLTLYDEFLHWRTLIDIQRTGRLFTANPLFGVGPDYPGMEIATSAVIGATGLPVAAAAPVIVGASHLLLTLCIFLFLEELGGRPRLAAAGTLVYLINPRFLFFESQYAYESMALALAALILLLEIRRRRDTGAGWLHWVAAVLVIAALVVTHHVTAYLTTAFLALWAVAGLVLRQRGAGEVRRRAILAGRGVPVVMIGLLCLAEALWLLGPARETVAYLASNLDPVAQQVGAMLLHRSAGRQLFKSSGGQVEPRWEEVMELGSALLVLAALPFGLLRLWRGHRRQAAYVALGLAALVYPVSLALHFTPSGAEVAGRMSEFLFLGVAAVVALSIDEVWPAEAPPARVRAAVAGIAGWLAVVLCGGVLIGWPPVQILPGPYLVGADSRSVSAPGIAAATWSLRHLGPDNRFATDAVDRELIATYGDQDPITEYRDNVDTARLFLSPTFDAEDRAILRRGHIRYILVDERLATARPVFGIYFENPPETTPASRPIPSKWLNKFGSVPGASLVYDSGDIRIYDMGALLGER